ncbi:MAG: SDR family NAD(P)-dependent oxidoreductase [Ardenticatenaceae bacterium]|nr:SDR family NAD(P)-dependent oxidoreductase [Ardenticatenaceae bacterium]
MSEDKFADQFEGTEIAIVGLAGRFPGAANVDEFWQNIRSGVDSIRPLTDEEARAAGATDQQLQDPNFIKVNSALDELDGFDADFFGYNPRDAEIMDPQQRVFLESAWTALEHAGYDPAQYKGLIGVFGGSTTSSYLVYNLATNPQLLQHIDQGQIDIGNGADFLSTRVSYKFNLRGPSFTVQTACSTSLVAVHLACQALLGDECDMALAGGVAVHVDHPKGYQFVDGSILSPDGRTRTYDTEAVGTVFSSGVGVVVLKRLEDALADGDHIHGIILGTAINNDGSDKVGFPAPGVDGQAAVITEALSVAGVDAADIQYVEGHGSGTRLGDPIEIRAITKAFRTYTDETGYCPIGSVKTNVGHLTGAAGIAGLIKTVMAIENQEIPPSLNFETPNPEIDFGNAPVYPNPTLVPWETPEETPRIAGVSSFGLGGTNAHLILREAPEVEPSDESDDPQLIVLSAKTATALEAATERLASHLRQHPEQNLADVAYTLQVGRQPFAHRRLLTASTTAEALAALETKQYTSQTVPLQTAPALTFVCTGAGADTNTARELYEGNEVFRQQIESCAVLLRPYLGIDLRTLLYPADPQESNSLSPRAVATAAAFALEIALAKTWEAWGIMPESVLGVGSGEVTAAVLSGVISLADGARLAAAGELLALQADHIHAQTGELPIFSTQHGNWMGAPDYTFRYWSHLLENSNHDHLADKLVTALEGLQQLPSRQLLFLGQITAKLPGDLLRVPHFATLADDTTTPETLQQTLGKLWLAGTAVAWQSVHEGEFRHRVILPTYPFERKRYWIEARSLTDQTHSETLHKNADLSQWGYLAGWQSAPNLPPFVAPETAAAWLIFSDDTLGPLLAAQLEAAGQTVARVRPGASWDQEGNHFTLNPADEAEFAQLFATLPNSPDHILFLWSTVVEAPFYPLAYLAKAAGARTSAAQLHIVTWEACAVNDTEALDPAQAALFGLSQTMPQEYAQLTSQVIDITSADKATARHILAECVAELPVPQAALRGRKRWVQTVVAAPLIAPETAVFRSDATYLITGGLTDIGYDIARTVAEKTSANLLLIDEQPASATQLAELAAAGSKVAALQADLTDGEALKTAVTEGIAQCGSLAGVIHSPTVAGQQAFQAIAEIKPGQSDIFFRTKQTSLAALAEVIADLPLEFCVVSSALSTVLGGVGFAAFTAAAHSANALVQQLNRRSAFPWLALNWDVWKFDQDANMPVMGELSQLALDRQEGFAILERAVGTAVADILLISTANLPRRIAQRQQKSTAPDKNLYERPALWTEYVAPRNPIEERVVTIWQQVLGIEKIGVDDNFFELGGHSLLATQLRNQLHNEFGVELSLQQLFADATAAGVAQGIADGLASGAASDKPILEQLKEAFPVERPSLVEKYLRQKIANGLNISPDQIPADGDLSGFDLQLAAVDLMWNLKRDLKVQFYPHEILGTPKLPELAQFVYQQQDRMANLAAFATEKPLSAYTIKEHRANAYNRAPFTPPAKKNKRMLFVLSSPRSGSTLFRVMLAGHKQIFCPPEISLLFFKDMQEWQQNVSFGQDFTWPAEGLHWALVELLKLEPEEGWAEIERMVAENHTVPEVYNRIQTLAGDQLVVDKTPPYAMDMETLRRAEQIFDDAIYIHLVRHPYAMMESFLRVRLDQQFSSSLFEDPNPDPYIVAETIWATANRNLTTFLKDVDPARKRVVRYEDLVQQPEKIMRDLCELMGLPYEPALITPYDGRRERMMGGIGDPNILTHTGIDPTLADTWREITLPRRLDMSTRQLAEQFGYELPDNYKAWEGERPLSTTDANSETKQAEINVDDLSDDDVAAMLSQLLEAEEQG